MVFLSRIGWQPPVNVYFKGNEEGDSPLDKVKHIVTELSDSWCTSRPEIETGVPKGTPLELELNQHIVDAFLFITPMNDIPPEQWDRAKRVKKAGGLGDI
ncbi:MAG: hypothetical protein QE263_05945 [Vampirovibrionales bacterium]|nr:hypothetical protein [Vampirovibrionales bacterium]